MNRRTDPERNEYESFKITNGKGTYWDGTQWQVLEVGDTFYLDAPKNLNTGSVRPTTVGKGGYKYEIRDGKPTLVNVDTNTAIKM